MNSALEAYFGARSTKHARRIPVNQLTTSRIARGSACGNPWPYGPFSSTHRLEGDSAHKALPTPNPSARHHALRLGVGTHSTACIKCIEGVRKNEGCGYAVGHIPL